MSELSQMMAPFEAHLLGTRVLAAIAAEHGAPGPDNDWLVEVDPCGPCLQIALSGSIGGKDHFCHVAEIYDPNRAYPDYKLLGTAPPETEDLRLQILSVGDAPSYLEKHCVTRRTKAQVELFVMSSNAGDVVIYPDQAPRGAWVVTRGAQATAEWAHAVRGTLPDNATLHWKDGSIIDTIFNFSGSVQCRTMCARAQDRLIALMKAKWQK